MSEKKHYDLVQKVNSKCAESTLLSLTESFLQIAYKALEKEKEQNELVLSVYDNPMFQMKMDAFDLLDSNQVALYICDYNNNELKTISIEEIDSHVMMVKNFADKSKKDDIYKRFDASTNIFQIAKYIYENEIKIQIHFVTNKILPRELYSLIKEYEKNNIYITDLKKLYELDVLDKEANEEVVFKIENGLEYVNLNFNSKEKDVSSDDITMYSFFVEGYSLACLYEKYGYSLLEGNVRSYLKKTQKTNAGILETIKSKPKYFVSFNNGLSTVADKVIIENGKIKEIVGWKIVNGGQTTATIFEAYCNEYELENVYVPVKLTVINKSDDKASLIAKIAEYANTQSKVNQSDLSSNEKYYQFIEEYSRKICVPKKIVGNLLDKWYFERLAGQYEMEKSRRNAESFQLEFPKKNKFDKKIMARAVMSWEQEPYSVSLGGEKNFIVFNSRIQANEGTYKLDEDYYTSIIATIILYNSVASVVDDEGFGGFKANITTYVTSLISYLCDKKLDLNRIWVYQSIDDELSNIIKVLARDVNELINDTPVNNTNVAMYCRKEDCWKKIKEYDYGVKIPSSWLVDKESDIAKSSSKAKVGLEIIDIMSVSANEWGQLSKWGKETEKLTPPERSMAFSMAKLSRNSKKPSAKQLDFAKSIIRKAYQLGFKYQEDN